MQNIKFILVLILIIVFISIISFKIKENFKDDIFGLKIFVVENDDESCNTNDKKNWKCGWDIIGTYPGKNFPKFDKIHMYNKPNIIVVSKGLQGDKGLIGDPGDHMSLDTKLILNNINKINDYTNKDLIINSDSINIDTDNKIKLHEYTKICANGNNCFDNRIFNNIYDYFYTKDTSNTVSDIGKPKLTHPDDCTTGNTCYFKNINTARMYKAEGQICDMHPEYDLIVCKY